MAAGLSDGKSVFYATKSAFECLTVRLIYVLIGLLWIK